MLDGATARSLVEAHIYLDLTVSGGSAEASVIEVPDGWLVRAGGVEVPVSYEGEHAARRSGATFGTGASELLDAGQWVLIGATYASRALEGQLDYVAGAPDAERFRAVETDWIYAADAVAEALKFLPEGAAELPPEAFWTEMGRSAREADPGRFTRAKLESDHAFFRQSLGDFRRIAGPAAGDR
ncbi:hypothetical protein ACFMQL_32285 [Nonomuraea fastidiosa]|jgi:hypothetical protein|uniref:hypothetical protein n=1 Tax=Nonomuraea TaxID=83681 RepID=UPI00324ED83B